MKFYSFGGIVLPTTYQDEDMPISAQSNLVELPDGAFDMGGNEVALKPVTLRYRFQFDPTIDTKMDALLSKMLRGRRILQVVMRDGTYRQTFAKLLSVNRPRSPYDKLVQQVELVFAQDYPHWIASADEPHYLNHNETLDDGWTLDGNYDQITFNSDQEVPTITNSGGLALKRGTIVVRPASGASIDSLTILNKTNMMQLRYAGPVDYPKDLVIDFLTKRATLDMSNVYNFIELPAGQMDWFQLEVGANELQIDVTGRVGVTTMYYHWAREYA